MASLDYGPELVNQFLKLGLTNAFEGSPRTGPHAAFADLGQHPIAIHVPSREGIALGGPIPAANSPSQTSNFRAVRAMETIDLFHFERLNVPTSKPIFG
jgi:hypothetical protein